MEMMAFLLITSDKSLLSNLIINLILEKQGITIFVVILKAVNNINESNFPQISCNYQKFSLEIFRLYYCVWYSE